MEEEEKAILIRPAMHDFTPFHVIYDNENYGVVSIDSCVDEEE